MTASFGPTPGTARDTTPDATRRIVLWGAPGSGKSSYISTLVFYHRQADDRRRLCVLPANAVTAEWVALRVKAMRGDGPDERVQTRESKQLRFQLYDLPARAPAPPPFGEDARRPSRWLGELDVWDVPGDVYHAKPPAELLDAMLDATGIVLLIDPGHRPPGGHAAYYTSFFQDTLAALALRLRRQLAGRRDPRLDAQNRLTIPVAICLTKADEHEALRIDADRLPQLRAMLGESAGLLETSLTTYTVIAISALGRALERRDGRDVLSGEPQPWNAIAPLRWIFEHAAAPPPPRADARASDDRFAPPPAPGHDRGVVAGAGLPDPLGAPPAEVRP